MPRNTLDSHREAEHESRFVTQTAPDAPGAICVSEGVYASHLVALPVEAAAGRIRVRVTIGGSAKQNVRFYAMCVATALLVVGY